MSNYLKLFWIAYVVTNSGNGNVFTRKLSNPSIHLSVHRNNKQYPGQDRLLCTSDISGWIRISQREVCQPHRGPQRIIWPLFHEKCMEMKNFWAGGRTSLAQSLNPRMSACIYFVHITSLLGLGLYFLGHFEVDKWSHKKVGPEYSISIDLTDQDRKLTFSLYPRMWIHNISKHALLFLWKWNIWSQSYWER